MNDHQGEAIPGAIDARGRQEARSADRAIETEHLGVILRHAIERLARLGAEHVVAAEIAVAINTSDAGTAARILAAAADRIEGLGAAPALREVLEFRILRLDAASRDRTPDAVAAIRQTVSSHRALLPDQTDPGLGATVRWLVGALAGEIEERITDDKALAAFVISAQQRLHHAIGEATWRRSAAAKRLAAAAGAQVSP